MNFNDWFLDLQTRTAPNAGEGLVAFEALLKRVGNPQQKYQIIHVAGTNGKGTVCTLLAHALGCGGLQTGLFVSPHLCSPTERIQLNGQSILEEDFISCVQTVLAAKQEPLNFFELITAAALVYFAQKHAQYVVLETGLGGRKDPTNVCIPVLSVITSIGLDHTAILGDTLAQIACEKAGIIKPEVPVLCGPVPDEAARVIEQTVLDRHAPLTWVQAGDPFYEYACDFVNGFTTLHTADQQEWDLHLLGSKQTQNACLVYHAAKRLGVPDQVIKTSFQTVNLPGRFERIKYQNSTLILDGAHNPQALEALLEFWQRTPYALQSPTLLCGFMKDKDFPAMLRRLSPHFARVIVTPPPSARAATQNELGDLLNAGNITFVPDYRHALTQALTSSVVLCTGSFYLVGAVRAVLGAESKNSPS